jgi:hypothetical protein
MMEVKNLRVLRTVSLFALFVICLFGRPAEAQTSTYVFDSDQSTVVQTGGIASVHWTYSIEGQFVLAVDPNAGTASFAHVDANATDDSPFKRTLDPNHVFNMTTLVGTVIDDATIKFTGKALDESDILITLTLAEYSVHLAGQTTPPPGSADFFEYELDAVAQKKYGGGTGEPNDPYQIATADDLMLLGESPEDYDKHFILTADIDLDPNLPGRKVFDRAVIAPVNDSEDFFQGTRFTGVFDGNDLTISNMIIEGGEYLGLFGVLENGAEVKNLGVVDVNITGSGGPVGGLAGLNYGSITMSYSMGSVTGEGGGVGGLVGSNIGIITSSYSTGSVSGDGSRWGVGGLVGWNDDSGIISSYSTGSVSGDRNVGGLVGANSDATITMSYSTGSVSGDRNVGGLVGSSYGHITMSYSTGMVTGDDEVGGLVGYTPEGSITSSFWDMETSDQTTSAGGIGKTTAEMKQQSTFESWDFVNVWGIGENQTENQTYPYLRKYSAADINQDDTVSFPDLAILAENWLADIAP